MSQATSAEFWGGLFDGVEGSMRPNPKRTAPFAHLLLRTVEAGLVTPELLEIYAGSAVSIFQFRRRLMSLLEHVYTEPRGAPAKAVLPMSAPLKDELLAVCVLLPQAFIDFRTQGAPLVVASDASSSAEAAVSAPLLPDVSSELCRHGLQKGLWSRLLKPTDALLRERGQLADDEQLPSGTYVSHPLWETMSKSLRFSSFGKVRKARKRRHINIGEMRAAIAAEARVGRLWPNSRCAHLMDSQVAIAALMKGRSSSPSLNIELRKSLGAHLGYNVRPSFGFLKTHLNPSDDPTWGKAVRGPCEDPPDWLRELLLGNFEPADAHLARCGMHLEQLAELPPAEELLPGCPSARCPKEGSRRKSR